MEVDSARRVLVEHLRPIGDDLRSLGEPGHLDQTISPTAVMPLMSMGETIGPSKQGLDEVQPRLCGFAVGAVPRLDLIAGVVPYADGSIGVFALAWVAGEHQVKLVTLLKGTPRPGGSARLEREIASIAAELRASLGDGLGALRQAAETGDPP